MAKIDGYSVDLILRDIRIVENIIETTNKGKITFNYKTGHPSGFIDVMYRGELASCKMLSSANQRFIDLKKKAEIFPNRLKANLIKNFMFETNFSLLLAEKTI